MPTINLKDFYYWCDEDTFVEVTEEMLEAMKAADRQQEAYRRRTYRYKAQYSLDCHAGMENDVLYHAPSPEEICIQKMEAKQLYDAIAKLTEIQQRRLKLYFFEGLTYRQIAEIEGVSHNCIGYSIKGALKKLKGFESKGIIPRL